MKRKNAIIFTACLILSAGAALGLKVKEKTEKNQIKKELETVLIPNAERELDSLILAHRILRDSVVYFRNELPKQSKFMKIKPLLTDAQEISKLLQNIYTQWHNEYSKTKDEIAMHYLDAAVPLHLNKRLSYLTDEIVLSPVNNCIRLDFIAETLQFSLDGCISCFEYHDGQDVQAEYKYLTMLHNTLLDIKELLSVINKNQNIINKQDLKQLEIKTNKLLADTEKIYTAHQGKIIADKLNHFKQQKIETDIKLDKQMRKVAELKANFAVDKIYKSRHK